MRIRRIYLPLIFCLALACLQTAIHAETAKVIRVIDGDTIELETGQKVRLIGVDTPETVHPSKPVEFMGKEASEFTRRLLQDKFVRLELDVETKDKYDRLLAYVYLDTLFVNAELVRQGYAQVLTIPPNVRYADLFVTLQRQAREAGRGLWNEAAATAWVSTKPSTDATKYYVTKTGTKYHRGGCKYLSKSAFEITVENALAKGFGACSVCIGAQSTGVKSKPSKAGSGQCMATTKKGTRCKRTAKAGSSYCWQHGG